jgi:hypothetical protein
MIKLEAAKYSLKDYYFNPVDIFIFPVLDWQKLWVLVFTHTLQAYPNSGI